jgi:hypothetical protein
MDIRKPIEAFYTQKEAFSTTMRSGDNHGKSEIKTIAGYSHLYGANA